MCDVCSGRRRAARAANTKLQATANRHLSKFVAPTAWSILQLIESQHLQLIESQHLQLMESQHCRCKMCMRWALFWHLALCTSISRISGSTAVEPATRQLLFGSQPLLGG